MIEIRHGVAIGRIISYPYITHDLSFSTRTNLSEVIVLQRSTDIRDIIDDRSRHLHEVFMELDNEEDPHDYYGLPIKVVEYISDQMIKWDTCYLEFTLAYEDGVYSIQPCHPEDNFSKHKGRKAAVGRLKAYQERPYYFHERVIDVSDS